MKTQTDKQAEPCKVPWCNRKSQVNDERCAIHSEVPAIRHAHRQHIERERAAIIKDRALAELQRQLDRTTGELATLESLSRWGGDTYRFGIQHARQRIAKLKASIEAAQ